MQASQPSMPCPLEPLACVCSVLLWHWCSAHGLVRIHSPAWHTRPLRPQLLGSSLPQVIAHQLIGRSRRAPGSQSLPQPALGPPSAPSAKPCRACVQADSRMSELLIHVAKHTAFPTARHTLSPAHSTGDNSNSPPLPPSPVTTTLLSVPVNLTPPRPSPRGLTQCLSFCGWLVSARTVLEVPPFCGMCRRSFLLRLFPPFGSYASCCYEHVGANVCSSPYFQFCRGCPQE